MEDRFMKNWAGLVTLVLALTACGKSLQMKAKPEDKATAGSTGDVRVVVTPSPSPSPSPGASVSTITGKDGQGVPASGPSETATDPAATANDPAATDGSADKAVLAEVNPTDLLANTDGQLTQISVKDYSEMQTALLFDNGTGTDAIRSVGVPACKDPVGYVKKSNLMFRAVMYFPKAEEISEITNAQLILHKVVRHSENGGRDSTSLKDQVLCLYGNNGKQYCSGEIEYNKVNSKVLNANNEIRSRAFADAQVSKNIPNNAFQNLSTTEMDAGAKLAEGDLVLDLAEIFNLGTIQNNPTNMDNFVDFLIDNSEEYSHTGYRKFRFTLGNNVYFESGQLRIQYSLKNAESTSTQQALQASEIKNLTDAEAYDFKEGKCEDGVAAVSAASQSANFSHERHGKNGSTQLTDFFNAGEITGLGKVARKLDSYKDKIEKINISVTAGSDAAGTTAAVKAREKMATEASGISSVLTAGQAKGVKDASTPKKINLEIVLKPMAPKDADALKAKIEQELRTEWP